MRQLFLRLERLRPVTDASRSCQSRAAQVLTFLPLATLDGARSGGPLLPASKCRRTARRMARMIAPT